MEHKKPEKGEYGYRDYRKRQRLFYVLLLLVSILVQVAIRSFTQSGTFRVLFTITAILTVLPMANILSPLLASWKYKTPDRSFYDRVRPFEDRACILYDLILTTKEQVIPLDAVIVHPVGVIAYCPNPSFDTAKAEAGIGAFFAENRLEPNLHILKDEKGFIRRLNSLKPASDFEDDGVVNYEVQILKTMCM